MYTALDMYGTIELSLFSMDGLLVLVGILTSFLMNYINKDMKESKNTITTLPRETL